MVDHPGRKYDEPGTPVPSISAVDYSIWVVAGLDDVSKIIIALGCLVACASTGQIVEPKILDRDSFLVLGIQTRITPEMETHEHFGSIWSSFESHHDRIKPHSTDGAYYGVRFPGGAEGHYDYLAGMAVGKVAEPEDLVQREVPAARFAVFESPVADIGRTYLQIFRDWLPRSSFKIDASAPVFEQYPPENRPDLPVLIHIPVAKQ
jgi:predicted transcriptional regulator YdeE